MFSDTYEQARERFRKATAGVEHGAIEVVDGLTIDWAFTGDRDATRVLVLSSGLHGVEGFGGSAMQLQMLAEGTGVATLWVHALNPWGMKHLRRVNENSYWSPLRRIRSTAAGCCWRRRSSMRTSTWIRR